MSIGIEINDLAMKLVPQAGLARTIKLALENSDFGDKYCAGAVSVLADGLDDIIDELIELSDRAKKVEDMPTET